MTYRSRGRALTEVLLAVIFVCFLVGFVTVLCIGNFYRAKRAMERQKQRRQEHNYLQNLEQQPLQSQGLGEGTTTNYRNTNHTNSDYSPKSAYSSSSSSGPTNTTTGIQQLQQQLHQRRNNNNNNNIYNTSVGNDRNNNSIDDDETDITVDLIM